MLFVRRLLNIPFRIIQLLKNKLIFGSFGIKSRIDSPLQINGGKNIFIGNKCYIQYKTWLAAMPLTNFKPTLIIEDGCVLGNFNHIYATHSIILHKNVLTADKVYISDNLHGYDIIDIPIKDQPIIQKSEVEIGEGSWLGENVCVLGAKIGKHCVIGSNSVVTKDIPDYCVAIGAPARIIKQYDFNENRWEKVDFGTPSEIHMGGGKFCYFLCAA